MTPGHDPHIMIEGANQWMRSKLGNVVDLASGLVPPGESAAELDVETRFIAAVVQDPTKGERWKECRRLPTSAFENRAHAQVWRAVLASADFDEVVASANAYRGHRLTGQEYVPDRNALFLRVLSSMGLHKAAEWLRLLPCAKLGLEDLNRRAFDLSRPPAASAPRFFLSGKPIFTSGNVGVILGPVKVGKSAVEGAMLAAVLQTTNGGDADCLGFRAAANESGLALIHIDTEQAPDDHHELIVRALKRARVTEPPAWLRSYCFTGLSASQCRAAFAEVLDAEAARFGGIYAVLVDGVADLVDDVNDAAEAGEFVANLQAIAIRHAAPVVGVIHINPSSETAKTRGHLGSQLERKAETNLRIEKKDDVTVIFAEKNRRAPISKSEGPCFRWSDGDGMHVSTSTRAQTKDDAKRARMRMLAAEVFDGKEALGYTELKQAITTVESCNPKTAERHISAMKDCQVIRFAGAGKYLLAA